MRSLLLVFCLGLAVSASVIVDKSYRTDKEYRYKYETQISTAMIPASDYHSGFKMSALARVQFTTRSEVRVMFEDIVLYKIDQPVVSLQAETHTLPSEHLQVWTGPDSETVMEFLHMPFAFKYIEGQVVVVFLDERETTWSANTKKGFMYLFEMNLEKRFLLEENLATKTKTYTPQTAFYNVFERAPTGDCATLYSVKSLEDEHRMYVSKVRNYEKCLDQPVHLVSPISGVLGKDHVKDQPLTRQANIDYSVKGTLDKFLILSAVAEERIVFSPYARPQDGQIRTTVNQTLTIIDSQLISETSEIPPVAHDPTHSNGITMVLPSIPVDSQDPFRPTRVETKTDTTEKDVYSVDLIMTHLKLATQNTVMITSKESLFHLKFLTEMLTTSPETVLRGLFDELKKDKETNRVAIETLWNLLPSVGTEAAANVILDILSTDVTMMDNCTLVLNRLTLTVTPTPQLIEKLINLIYTRRSEFKKLPQLKQVLYLTLGSWGYKLTDLKNAHWTQMDTADGLLKTLERDNQRYIRKMVRHKKQEVADKRTAVTTIYNNIGIVIMQELRKLIEEGNYHDQILGIKAIGNSGLPQTIPVLKKLLLDPETPHFMRIMTILGFRRVTTHPEAKEEAVFLLTELFMNDKETHEVRNMAFTILMSFKPDLPVVEKMALKMHHEKDMHVAGYVLSTLESYANATFEPFEPEFRRLRVAIETAPMYSTGMEHSFFKFFGKYFEEYKMGATVSLASIGSMERYEGWALQLDSVIYGLHSKLFEIGVNTQGLSKFLNQLFGPKGLVTAYQNVIDHFSRTRRDTTPKLFIQKIFQELNIKPRDFLFPDGNIYVKFMGHEMRYFEFLNTITPLLTGQVKDSLSWDGTTLSLDLPVDLHQLMCVMYTKLSMPTQAGLPVALQVIVGKTAKIHGDVNFKFRTKEETTAPLTLELGLDLKPKVVAGMVASMGLDDFFLKPTMSFYSLTQMNQPMKNMFSYDLVNKKLTTTFKHEEQDTPVFETMSEPVSYFLVLRSSTKTPMIESNIRPIYTTRGERTMPLMYTREFLAFGWKLLLTGQYPITTNSILPTLRDTLKGRTLINLWLKPIEYAAKTTTLTIKYLDSTLDNTQTDTKMDTFGRPLHTTLENVEVPSDPIDVNMPGFSLKHVIKKIESLSGNPFPTSLLPHTNALLINLDTSTDTVSRIVTIQTLWSKIPSGKATTAHLLVWRTPRPGLDTEPWQMLTRFDLTYPLYDYGPLDVYSPVWQKELLQELNYHVMSDYSKVVNQLMNLTFNSMTQRLNFPAMRLAPAHRVLNGLMPEHLIATRNSSTWFMWTNFAKHFGHLLDQVTEELDIIVDPYFTIRDDILKNLLQRHLDTQKLLILELGAMLTSRSDAPLSLDEFPTLQWTVLTQSDITNSLGALIAKYKASGSISNIPWIENTFKLNTKAAERTVTLVANLFSKDGAFLRAANANNKKTSTFSFYATDLIILRKILQNVTMEQVKMIKEMTLRINRGDKMDTESLLQLTEFTHKGVDAIDDFIRVMPIDDTDVIADVLLVTVNNELLTHLWQSAWEVKVTRPLEQNKLEILCDRKLKMLSYSLGARAAHIFKEKKVKDIVVPELKDRELPLWRSIETVKRNLLVDDKYFTLHMENPDVIKAFMEMVLAKFDTYLSDLANTIVDMVALPELPTVHLTTNLLETLSYLRAVAESTREAMLMVTFEERLQWIPKLDHQLTLIQAAISDLSPIFERYTKDNTLNRNTHTLSPVPINQQWLEFHHIHQHQTMILKQLREYLSDKTLSKLNLQHLLVTAVDKCEDLLDTLTHTVPGTGTSTHHWNPLLTALQAWTMHLQHMIHTTVKSALDTQLPVTETTNAATHKLTVLDAKLSDLKQQIKVTTDKTSSLGSSQTSHLPLAFTPPTILGLVNVTWGHTHAIKKEAILEMTATRSLEQLFWLYKQLDGVTRDQGLVSSVNRELRGDPWGAETFRTVLNKYNHVHLTAKFEPEQLPRRLRQLTTSFHEFLKHHLWPHYTRQEPVTGLDKTTLETVITFSDHHHKWDMSLLTPTETNVFVGMESCPFIDAVTPTQAYLLLSSHKENFNTGKFAPATCSVTKDAVSTWDTVTYQLPLTNKTCTQVLAMDCSPEESFAVTITPTEVTTGDNIVEIRFGDKQITLSPHLMDMTVTVDNKQITLEDGKPFNVLGELMDVSLVEATIVRHGLRVEVTLPPTGLFVALEGPSIMVKVSPLYKKRMCGLCSNFDSQRSWEFEGPQEEVYTEDTAFVKSYALPSTCKATTTPAIAPKHGITYPLLLSNDELAKMFQDRLDMCSQMKEIIAHTDVKGKRCFTEDYEEYCPEDKCYAIEYTIEVYHGCLPLTDPRVEDWTRRANLGTLTPEEVKTLTDRQLIVTRFPWKCDLFPVFPSIVNK